MCEIEKTVISEAPKNTIVNASSDVTFSCQAVTDLSELTSLKVIWRKEGVSQIISNDNRLRLHNVRLNQDDGNYTCTATNGLDSDQRSVQLIIKGIEQNIYIEDNFYLISCLLVNCNY